MTLTIPLIIFYSGTKAVSADINGNFSALSADVIANYNSIQTIQSNYVHTDGTTPFLGQQNGIDPTVGTQGLVTVNYLNQHQTNFDYFKGFTLSNDSTNFQSTIDIAPGQCSDSQNISVMTQKTSFTKNLFNTWQKGTGNGGRASAATLAANTTFFVFIISDINGNNVDFGFDTSVTAANLLPYATTISSISYTQFRRIGSIVTQPSTYNLLGTVAINGTTTVTGTGTLFTQQCVVGNSIIIDSITKTIASITNDTTLIVNTAFSPTASGLTAELSGTNAIIPFYQQGNRFIWQTQILDYSSTGWSSPTATALSMPNGISIIPILLFDIETGATGSDGNTQLTIYGSSTLMPIPRVVYDSHLNVNGSISDYGITYSVPFDYLSTNNGQLIFNGVIPVAGTINIFTNGYIDNLG